MQFFRTDKTDELTNSINYCRSYLGPNIYIYIYIYIYNLSELEIVKFKQLDGAGAPSSCLNLTISSERPLGSPGAPWGALGGIN